LKKISENQHDLRKYPVSKLLFIILYKLKPSETSIKDLRSSYTSKNYFIEIDIFTGNYGAI